MFHIAVILRVLSLSMSCFALLKHLFKLAMGSYASVQNIHHHTFFYTSDTQKHQKMYFFVFPTITGHSDAVDPIWVAP